MYNKIRAFCFAFIVLTNQFVRSTQLPAPGEKLCTVVCSGNGGSSTALNDHFSSHQSEMDVIKENVRNNSMELSQIRMYLQNLLHFQQNSTLTADNRDLRFTRGGVTSISRNRVLSLPKGEQEIEIVVEKGVPEIVPDSSNNVDNAEPNPRIIKTVPSDCEEVRRSLGQYYIGRYYTQINPGKESNGPTFIAGCELRDDAGWTIIQKRIDGLLSFDRTWGEYKDGFGHVEGEFWLGNDKIHRLTKQNNYRLRIELQTGSDRRFFAEYSHFRIADESDNYRLMVSGYAGGSAGDALTGILSHNGSLFTTRDRDNDKYEGNCAVQYHGGWWFHSCFVAFLNGIVPNSRSMQTSEYTTRDAASWHSRKVRSFYVPAMMQDGIVWRTINKRQTRDSSYYDDIVIKAATMMIAPRS